MKKNISKENVLYIVFVQIILCILYVILSNVLDFGSYLKLLQFIFPICLLLTLVFSVYKKLKLGLYVGGSVLLIWLILMFLVLAKSDHDDDLIFYPDEDNRTFDVQ